MIVVTVLSSIIAPSLITVYAACWAQLQGKPDQRKWWGGCYTWLASWEVSWTDWFYSHILRLHATSVVTHYTWFWRKKFLISGLHVALCNFSNIVYLEAWSLLKLLWCNCRAVPVGAISYEQIEGERMKRDVLFCYDLELPPDFQPHNKGLSIGTCLLKVPVY